MNMPFGPPAVRGSSPARVRTHVKFFPSPTSEPRAARRAGSALLEVAVALPILAVALGLYAQILVAGSGLRDTGKESWLANSRAKDTLEHMRNADFRQLFVLYNEDPFDDPGGPGTAPGAGFHVPGLDPVEGDADGFVGRVILPGFNAGSEVVPDWQVREDQIDPVLGGPRDLNGDVLVDATDHRDDYLLLPVRVEVVWQGLNGPRNLSLETVLAELR